MAKIKKEVSLTPKEKRIVKALIAKGWKSQDIQASINLYRKATINFGRIAGIKKNPNQQSASDEEVEFYLRHKEAHDPQTGLNLYDDERLIRAREAMSLAVQIFNSPALKFKSEVFSTLSNIAWTYLLHEFYHRKGVTIVNKDGNSLLLGQMVERDDCPVSELARINLRVMKKLRDSVEHRLMKKSDSRRYPLFQACCLNFDKAMCELFGSRLTLSHDLSFALQFAKLNMEQTVLLNKYELPENIDAIDAHLMDGITEEQAANIEFQFRVIYTLDAASKSKAHYQFINPASAEGKEIHNVLGYLKAADEMYPYKPNKVVAVVSKKSGVKFTAVNHTKAWKHYNVRPKGNVANPEKTNKEFCLYHQAHGDYTYSEAWLNKLIDDVSDPVKFAAIKAEKI